MRLRYRGNDESPSYRSRLSRSHVCGTDGIFNVNFKACQSLVEKPKLVFPEFCRGPTMGRGSEVHDSVDESAVETALSKNDLAILRGRRPIDADFLISYSKSPKSL